MVSLYRPLTKLLTPLTLVALYTSIWAYHGECTCFGGKCFASCMYTLQLHYFERLAKVGNWCLVILRIHLKVQIALLHSLLML